MQSIIDVAMLAPGTSRGSSAVDSTAKQPYNNLASFGGSSIAENQYYINGFNVTNLFRNIEYAQLPFYAIDSQQVLTGGYGPEYGLSTGGVVSLTTMKGTNSWRSGASANWTPNSLRAEEGKTTLNQDGTAYRSYSANQDSSSKYDFWAGGPLIEDKLFIFGIVEISKDDTVSYPKSYSNTRNTWDETQKRPFGLVKLDWNINEKNLVEVTGIRDTTKYTTAQYSTPVDASGFVTQGNYLGTDINERGGWIGIGKYTSYLTDNITFSALYGQIKSDRSEHQYAKDGTLISYNGVVNDFNQPGCPTVSYAATWANANKSAARPSCFVSTSIDAATGEDERKSGRVDLEYKVPQAFLGTHTLTVGYDADRWTSFYGSSYSGGSNYTYNNNATNGNYVRVRHFQTGANAGVDSDAYYLKDDWQLSKNLLLQVGLRNDSFKNKNGADETYLTQDNIWQPRLGLVWDPKGDSTRKVYGSVGLYSLPVTAGISVRGASASIYTSQYFLYNSIDPVTGAPALGAPLGAQTIINGENGEVPAAGTFAATNLDPTQQEEFIVGYQQDLGNHWKGGVRATYRNLLKTIDDMCDARPFDSWAARTGFQGGTANIDNNVPCFVVNPGYGANLSYDLDGNGTLDPVQLTAADIGLPKAKRRYLGLEFTAEKPWADRWYTQFSYTWSHNYGNAEGLADSDNGQLDIGTTLAFDYPELTVGSYGNLPNDHRHTAKALGAYKPFDEWTISANAFIQSGKPINCIGVGPNDYGGYNASYFYCNGQVAPRGSSGTTSTIVDIGLGVSYTPNFAPGLSTMVSVYNILNRHGVTNVDEYFTDSQNAPLASYKAPYSYQSPRFVQLSARYDFDFRR
jgi:outer membrane receptor protein involved in Fe transport